MSPYGQRDAGPKHVAARKLAHSPAKTYSAFANGTDEITFFPQTKKAAKQTRRVLRPCQKAAKGGIGVGEGKESPERKTVGRGKGGKCRLLYQFCLFPSLLFPEGCPLWCAALKSVP